MAFDDSEVVFEADKGLAKQIALAVEERGRAEKAFTRVVEKERSNLEKAKRTGDDESIQGAWASCLRKE